MSYMYQRMIYLTRLYFVFYSFNFPDQTAGTVVSGAGKYMKIWLVKIDPQVIMSDYLKVDTLYLLFPF